MALYRVPSIENVASESRRLKRATMVDHRTKMDRSKVVIIVLIIVN